VRYQVVVLKNESQDYYCLFFVFRAYELKVSRRGEELNAEGTERLFSVC